VGGDDCRATVAHHAPSNPARFARIGLTLGQQSWLRLLDIDHHQVMAGSAASMAPGYEDEGKLERTKSSEEYRARKRAQAVTAR
jgi:acyl carrier protein phosphodiesterase